MSVTTKLREKLVNSQIALQRLAPQRAQKRNTGRSRLSWPETAIKLAFNIAEYRSEDPFVQVGAVAIKYDGSVNLGYNGAPSGIDIDWSDRDERRIYVSHAEANVLSYVKPGEVKFLAVTHIPCAGCMNTIAQKRIPIVYFRKYLENYSADLTRKLAKKYKIKLIKI